ARTGRGRTADIAGVVVRARVEVVVGLRAADCEAGELDERPLDVVAAASLFGRRPVITGASVGTQRAVFGLGTGIDRRNEAVAEQRVVRVGAVVACAAARDVRRDATAGVEVHFGADPTTDLDTSVGAGDVEEPGSVDAADLHVFDRLGLNGKIGSL